MSHFFTKLLAAAVILSSSSAYAGNYWKPFQGQVAPSEMPRSFDAKNYSLFTLNQNEIKGLFNSLTQHPESSLELSLPTPDNKMMVFKVWSTPIFGAGENNHVDYIQTFTAQSVEDPSITAKLDYTLFGFRALVLNGDKSYLIDPYSNVADGYYAVFYEKDLLHKTNFNGCTTQSLHQLGLQDAIDIQPSSTANKSNGSVRHVYRLAMSCTGEYAQAVAGANPTKAMVMSVIASTVNRVNAIYEKELSVSFNLIPNNDAIVYTDPATDPYSCNTNLDCLIGEVENHISTTIGNSNFDIGHILATAGGGLAALSAVCANGAKASGTSSSTGPNDYHVILHEMGHQFGANHTFSANTGGCNGNGEELNAYEPGSGSTIMSYGGLCDPNNVTNSSDNYFSVPSLLEINNILTGQGSTCGDIVPGTAPVAFDDFSDTLFYIPKNTPFELRGPEATSTQANSTITYVWEQFDLGNFGQTEEENGDAEEGPLFRSYTPTANRSRVFPTVNYILDGSYSGVGERLPQKEREMNFKYTARSASQSWGTFKFTDYNVKLMVLDVDEFRVTGPASDETWNPGEVKTITWDKGGTVDAPINCGFVNIYLSLDDGLTFPYVIVMNAPNTGSYDYTVYDVNTTKGRIKVQGTGQAFMDIGKGKLKITGTETGIKDVEVDQNFTVYPNPASDFILVQDKMNEGKNSIVLMDVLGNSVWNGDLNGELKINTAQLAKGTYFLRIIHQKTGKVYSKKIAIQ